MKIQLKNAQLLETKNKKKIRRAQKALNFDEKTETSWLSITY